jgi:AcrR family transcriptional regulator
VAGRASSNIEARQRLLAAGAELFYRRPIVSGLEQIRAVEVVDALGLTTGAFYHQWKRIEDYQEELLEYLLDPQRFPTVQLVLGDLLTNIQGLSFEEAVLSVANQAWSGLIGDPDRQRTFVALWTRDDPRVRERLAEQYEYQRRAWSQVLDLGLPLYQREPRPPWTTAQQAVTLTALIEGFFMRWAIDPKAVEEPGQETGFVSTVAEFIAATTQARGREKH